MGPGRVGVAQARPLLQRCPSSRRAQNVKQLYALVCETQRYSAVLDAVIASAGLLRAEKKLRPHLAKVGAGRGALGTPNVGGAPLGVRDVAVASRSFEMSMSRPSPG